MRRVKSVEDGKNVDSSEVICNKKDKLEDEEGKLTSVTSLKLPNGIRKCEPLVESVTKTENGRNDGLRWPTMIRVETIDNNNEVISNQNIAILENDKLKGQKDKSNTSSYRTSGSVIIPEPMKSRIEAAKVDNSVSCMIRKESVFSENQKQSAWFDKGNDEAAKPSCDTSSRMCVDLKEEKQIVEGDKLRHLNKNRAKAPNHRPPSFQHILCLNNISNRSKYERQNKGLIKSHQEQNSDHNKGNNETGKCHNDDTSNGMSVVMTQEHRDVQEERLHHLNKNRVKAPNHRPPSLHSNSVLNTKNQEKLSQELKNVFAQDTSAKPRISMLPKEHVNIRCGEEIDNNDKIDDKTTEEDGVISQKSILALDNSKINHNEELLIFSNKDGTNSQLCQPILEETVSNGKEGKVCKLGLEMIDNLGVPSIFKDK